MALSVQALAAPTTATASPTPFTPKLPLFFEKNEGQVDQRAGFLARMPNATLYLTGADAVLVHSGKAKDPSSALRMHWVGANTTADPSGEAEMTAKSNYFIGKDKSTWHTGITNFQRVRDNGLYPGVDLVYYGNQDQLEYDLTIQPGANASNIKLQIEGANKVSLDEATGNLLLVDAIGSPLQLLKPVVYQIGKNQERVSVSASYTLSARNTVSFVLGDYDHSRALVIDPQVVYSTLFSGQAAPGTVYGGMTVDSNGFVYLSGITGSADLPTTQGVIQTTCDATPVGCANFFVAKFDPTQTGAASLVYSTYIGGFSFETISPITPGNNLAVDAAGDAYFVGHVFASDNTGGAAYGPGQLNFPTTSNAYAPACTSDSFTPCPLGFLTKLNPSGSQLLYSTFLQPTVGPAPLSGMYYPVMVAVDGAQIAYLSGDNGGDLQPYFIAAYDTTKSGAASLVYATSVEFQAVAMAADSVGNLYVGGTGFEPRINGLNGTQKINLTGALTTEATGITPSILIRFNPAGVNTYATYFGTGGGDIINAVSADPNGIVYVAGGGTNITQVNGLPSGVGSGVYGAFVAKLDTTLTGSSSLLYSTYINAADGAIGGSNGNGALAVASNDSGQFAFSGFTPNAIREPTYPTANPVVEPMILPDGQKNSFVGIIDPSKTGAAALLFFSFIDGADQAYSLFLDQGQTTGTFSNNNVQGNAQGNFGSTENLYVAGNAITTLAQNPFLAVPGSYLSSVPSAIAGQPLFFYKIALGPIDELSTSPSSVKFPSQVVDKTSPFLPFTVTNISTSAVPITSVTGNAPFNVLSETCSPLLEPGASCTVNATYSPTVVSTSDSPTTGFISININNFSEPLTENMTGIGVASNTATGFFFPQSIAFGTQPTGSTSAAVPVTLTNTGTLTLFPANAGLNAGNFPIGFNLVSNNCGSTLASGATCQFSVAFAPTATTNSEVGNNYSATVSASSVSSIAFTGTAGAPTTKLTPTITWATPDAIIYGTALSATQLNATATVSGSTVAGTLAYTPLSGVLTAGVHTLSVIFTPQDMTTYSVVSATVQLTVNPANPVITWATPTAITYGTALSATQLDATANVAGTFAYTPSSGVLTAGTHTLGVVFTPTDTNDYNNVGAIVQLTVNQITPTITWATPTAIPYGTALSEVQLNATASVPGSFTYTPSSGVLTVGVHTLSVSFTPTDATDYASVPVTTVQLTVNSVTPTVTWSTPTAIPYGTALSPTQLDATANVAGTFVYTPSSGVLTAGVHTLSVLFTPTDTTDYTTATAQINLLVNRATLIVSATNSSKTVGAANPTFAAGYSGFVNGDNTVVLSGSPTLSTTATTSSPAGTYPITAAQGTLTTANYTFAFVNGTLSVIAAPTIVLTTTATLSTVINGYQALITVTNSGTGSAGNVTLTSATLGIASGSPTPQNMGNLGAGASGTFTVVFPASAGNPGAAVAEKYAGTYTGGSFGASVRAVTLP